MATLDLSTIREMNQGKFSWNEPWELSFHKAGFYAPTVFPMLSNRIILANCFYGRASFVFCNSGFLASIVFSMSPIRFDPRTMHQTIIFPSVSIQQVVEYVRKSDLPDKTQIVIDLTSSLYRSRHTLDMPISEWESRLYHSKNFDSAYGTLTIDFVDDFELITLEMW
jgi:hypothetical protein